MIVRVASPKGAKDRTFGIVWTGFNIGGVIGPVFLGYLLDQHLAKGVLWATVVFMVSTTLVVFRQNPDSVSCWLLSNLKGDGQ